MNIFHLNICFNIIVNGIFFNFYPDIDLTKACFPYPEKM